MVQCLRSEQSEWTIETIARDGSNFQGTVRTSKGPGVVETLSNSKLKNVPTSQNPGIFSEWLALWGSVMGVMGSVGKRGRLELVVSLKARESNPLGRCPLPVLMSDCKRYVC